MDEFYGTAAGFLTYHTARGRTDLEYTDGEIEAALLLASEWLDGAYHYSWWGTKTGAAAQWRAWPRIGIVDSHGYAVDSATVPLLIERATYEVALRELQAAGTLNADYTPNQYKSVRVEGAISVEYANVSAADMQVQIPILAHILAPLMRYDNTSGLSGKVVRA